MAKYYYYNGRIYPQEELTHYGVKGMKWGIRRKRNKSSNGKSRKSSGKSEAELKAKAERSAARKEKVSSVISSGKDFMNKYGSTMVKTAIALTFATLGAPYFANIVNSLFGGNNFDYSSYSPLDPKTRSDLQATKDFMNGMQNIEVIDITSGEVRDLNGNLVRVMNKEEAGKIASNLR